MNRSSLVRLALSAALCAGCSEASDPGSGAPRIIRLDLYPTAPEPRSREVLVSSVLNWPEDLAGVEAQGVQLSLQAHDPGTASPTLLMSMAASATRFPDPISIKLAGRFDPGTFNKLVLSADSQREAYVRCVFRRGGVPLLGSTNRARIEPRGTRTSACKIVLEFPAARELDSIPDELELILDSVQAPIRMGSLEFCHQPVWAWLPAAEEGFGMVSLDSDARSSVGLSTERSLEAEVVVPRNAVLRFSVGVPAPLRLEGANPSLRVEIHGGQGKPQVQRVPLESESTTSARWHKVRIALDSFVGQKLKLVFAFSVGDRRRESVCALTRPSVEVEKAQPRTVLLVTSDTHRADSVGAMASGGAIQTPAIDALASRGVLFLDCWSSTNVTIPSHAAIMTATSPRDTGVLDNYTRLSRQAITLAEAFQDAGFATYAVVSAPHLADASSGLGQGFDRMGAPTATNKRPAAESIRQLTDWLDDAEGQDLFVWLHVYDAHTPYQPPAEFEGRYWPAGRDAFDPALPEPSVPAVFRANMPEGLRDLRLLTARYHGEVSYLDAQLAILFGNPRIRSGVTALTADHGESLGEHGIFWEHAGLYTQTIHVPLILAWPKAPGGTRIAEPVFQLDLAQTLLHLADVEDPRIPGADLLGVQERVHSPRFTISSGADRASVTKDGWHLIVSLRSYLVTVGAEQKPFPRHHLELFELAKDPDCERDLARVDVARARDLRLLLCAWLAAASPRGWDDRENASAEMATHLAQLGYAAQSGGSTINPIDRDCSCSECAPFLPER